MANQNPELLLQDLSIFAVPADDLSAGFEFIGLGISDTLTNPLGDLNVINNPSAVEGGRFDRIGKYRSAPDLGEVNVIEYIESNRLALGERMAQLLCDWHLIFKDQCGRPDSLGDWRTLYHVLFAQASENDYGQLRGRDEAPPIELTTSLSLENVQRIFPIRLTEKANSIVLAETVDVIYADQVSCGTCAPFSTGCAKKFALTKENSSSVGLLGQIAFTEDGTTFNTTSVSSLTGDGTSLQAAGIYLFVTEQTTPSHHYALISDVLNTPSAQNFTAVTTGYQVGGGGRCSIAVNPNRVFVGGANGYIYLSTDITAGVDVIADGSLTGEDMNAIHYSNGNLLVVGDNNVVMFASNAASDATQISFGLITGPAVGVNLTACWIHNATTFEIGTADGRRFFSYNQGSTWSQKILPNQDNLSYINDIVYSPDDPLVGVIAAQTASAGYLYRIVDGRNATLSRPAIEQLGTAPEKYNAVALCGANSVFAGGKKASSTDGILAEAN